MVKASLFQMWPLLQRNRPISYSSNLAHIVGSVKAAILLSQMIYWTKKGVNVKANDGWFHKQAEHWTIETGLTRHEQNTARKLLVQLGFLDVQHKTSDGKKAHGMVSYRINLDRIGQALTDLIGDTIQAMNPLNLDDLQADSQVVRQLFGKPVSYHRALVDITGGTTSALLLSRMIYLQRRAYSSNGGEWFSVTTEFYRQELGMNRRQQESARKALRANKLIFESLLEDEFRRNRRLYQSVNVTTLTSALEKITANEASAASNANQPDQAASTPESTYETGNPVAATHVQNRQPKTSAIAERGAEPVGKQADQPEKPTPQAADEMSNLLLPRGIAGQELKDFKRWVARALPHRRQLLIDEFEYQRKRRIITSPVGYIRTLVERDSAANGELPLEGAYGVARNRSAAAIEQEVLKVPESPRTESGREAARTQIEQAKALLKMRGGQA